MVNGESSRLRQVLDRQAAEVLLDPKQMAALLPFFERPTTVSQAAGLTQTSVNTMYVRVQRFLALGLLTCHATTPRAGRATKHYTTSAERFFVPYAVMPFESLNQLHRHLDGTGERLLRKSLIQARLSVARDYGYEVGSEDGELLYHPAQRSGVRLSSSERQAPATVNLWDEGIALDFEDAKRFQAELYALYRRFKGKEGAQKYILRIGLAPITAP